MALILAIEPDRRQAAQLTDLVRTRVKAELVLADTTEGAFGAIGNRVPDLVLVPTLLSPQDDAALAGALRVIATAARVQMLTIPVLAECAAPPKPSGLLSRWRRRSATPTPTGCDPSVFADQIAAYLAEGAAERETEIDDVDGEPAITESIEQAPPPIEEPLVAHLDTIVVASILEPVATQIEEPAATSLEELVSASIEEPITRAVEETIVRAVEEPVIGVVKEPVIRVVEEPIIRVAEQPAAYAPEQTAYRSFEQPVVQTLSESVVPAIEDAPIEEPALAAHALAEVAAAEPATTVMAESTVLPVEDPFEPSLDDPIAIAIMRYKLPQATVEPSNPAVEFTSVKPMSQAELDVLFFAEAGQPVPELPAPRPKAAAKPHRQEWTELVASLRVDVERLRAERTEPSSSRVVNAEPARKKRRARKDKPLTVKPAASMPKPIQDQWGFFDPEQCGFAALLAKLEEITDVPDAGVARSE